MNKYFEYNISFNIRFVKAFSTSLHVKQNYHQLKYVNTYFVSTANQLAVKCERMRTLVTFLLGRGALKLFY